MEQWIQNLLSTIAGGLIALSSTFMIEIFKEKRQKSNYKALLDIEIKFNLELIKRNEDNEQLFSLSIFEKSIEKLTCFKKRKAYIILEFYQHIKHLIRLMSYLETAHNIDEEFKRQEKISIQHLTTTNRIIDTKNKLVEIAETSIFKSK